jgi:hypothetical protein
MAFCLEMKKKDLTPKQMSSVPCPTCGVAAGMPCELYSGGLRSGPHVDRKLAAADAVEAKNKSQRSRTSYLRPKASADVLCGNPPAKHGDV